jgi:hypothetical protein
MREKIDQFMPLARKEGIIVQRLPDEVLVYDLENHKAHCLNQTAALIWDHCDGKTSVNEIARLVGENGDAANEKVVWFGLKQLQKANLLPKIDDIIGAERTVTRRHVVRTLGAASLLSIPIVTSMLAPTAHAAASCAEVGSACRVPPDNLECCGIAQCIAGECV